ncbi:MAG: hypothetical protein ACFFAU_14150, partial [Candidatus Hodarchaeota archaeon]
EGESVVIMESGKIFAYNSSYSQIWNKTPEGAIANYADTLLYDFNGDSYEDVLFQMKFTEGNFTSTFEDKHNFRIAQNQIEGLTFSNTDPTTLGMGWIFLNASFFGVPWLVTHSGDMFAYTMEANNYIIIEDSAYEVSAWFSTSDSYTGDFNWLAYDRFGNLITKTTFTWNTSTQYARLTDPEGRIYKLVVNGTQAGWESNFIIDDLSYTSAGQPVKLIALSGANFEEIIWEYHIWDTHAIQYSQGDLDRDGEADDLLFVTEYTNYPHTGTINAIDGTYGTPLGNYQLFNQYGISASVAAGDFGEFGEVAIVNDYCYAQMVTYVRHEPTHYQKIAIQTTGYTSFETRGIVVDMAVGDFNADGVDDVVFGDHKRYIIALDGLTGDMIWKYRTSQPISQIAVWDFHLQDGYSDIAVVLKSGILIVINGETGRPLWQDYLGSVIVNEMEFVDVNNDGITEELAISMGFRFTPLVGRFVLYNVTKDSTSGLGSILWESYNPFGPFTQFEVADFDPNNGAKDFAVAIFDHSIWFISGTSGTPINWAFNAIAVAVHDFKVGNFTGESLPQLAVIIRNGTVVIYNSTDWTNPAADSIAAKRNLNIPFRLSHLAIGTFIGSGSGPDELVIRSFADASYCLSYISGSLQFNWRFEDRSIFYLPKYQVVDINNDTKLDILSLNYDNILALSGTTGEVIWASFVPTNLIRSIITGDFNNDDIPDVALGTADRMVYIIYGKEEQLVKQSTRIDGKIDISSEKPIIPQVVSINDEKLLTIHKISSFIFLLMVNSVLTSTFGVVLRRKR